MQDTKRNKECKCKECKCNSFKPKKELLDKGLLSELLATNAIKE